MSAGASSSPPGKRRWYAKRGRNGMLGIPCCVQSWRLYWCANAHASSCARARLCMCVHEWSARVVVEGWWGVSRDFEPYALILTGDDEEARAAQDIVRKQVNGVFSLHSDSLHIHEHTYTIWRIYKKETAVLIHMIKVCKVRLTHCHWRQSFI